MDNYKEKIALSKKYIFGELKDILNFFLQSHSNFKNGLRENFTEQFTKQRKPGCVRQLSICDTYLCRINKKPFKKWVERNATKLLNSKKSIAKQSLFPPKAIPKKKTEFKMEFTKKGYFTAETQKVLMAYLSDPTFDRVVLKETKTINNFIVERHPGKRKSELVRFVIRKMSYAPDHKTILDIAEIEVNVSNMLTMEGKISKDIIWLFSEKNSTHKDFEIKRIM